MRRLIARTPHSRVYLAQSPEGQLVALKELLFAQVPSTQELEAFEREARLLEAISHPRIPRLLKHFREGQGADLRLYLAAEYISGETLLDRLAHHTFSEEEARDIALQVLKILEYLHGRTPSILHRDIKPANIIRQQDGTLFLVDFGSARESLKGATVGSTLVGTFGYMPLEQFGGTVDVTSDLYALGASLVHLLGRTPPAEHFQPDRGLELSHLDAPSLGDWLRKVTALRPEGRYRSAALARKALGEASSPGASARATPLPDVTTLPPEAPPALIKLAREVQAGRELASETQQRKQAVADRKAQREVLRQERSREKKRTVYEDDRLSPMDFYRLSCLRMASPIMLPWWGCSIGGFIWAGLEGAEFVPPLMTPAGIGFVLSLLLVVHGVLVLPGLIGAVTGWRAFHRLPFALEGLGHLVHRADGDWTTFRRCTVSLRLKETDPSSKEATTASSVQAAVLHLIVDRCNATIRRVVLSAEGFGERNWKIQGHHVEGYANWRVGRNILAICQKHLVPLQRDCGLIEAVVIEPSGDHFSLGSGD